MESKQKIVYVAGPYRDPDFGKKLSNILVAWRAAERIWAAGHIAICPHANTILMCEARHGPQEQEVDFVKGDLQIIERCCDALWMLPGWMSSAGAHTEWVFAHNKKIPVFVDWSNLEEFLREPKGENDELESTA